MAPLVKATRNVFLLLIIFACIISSEAGRTLLNLKGNKDHVDLRESIKNYGPGVKEAGVFGGYDFIDRRVLDDDQADDQHVTEAVKSPDDFRPTAPGHSPGAGHSHGPANINPNQ
ncbi:hypothetical protein L484_026086 [Morus notabilis]|uniref:Uncharacterized protein n=1 Tax=Morus notabilis TaxID=981085 RepID=W9RIJ5_9ROSA|nr:hypothetical protein L484_026086 [Morus notabilis]